MPRIAYSIELTATESIGEPSDDQLDSVTVYNAREIEVLTLITQGLSNQDVSEKITMSEQTRKSHIRQAHHRSRSPPHSQGVPWTILHGFAPPIQVR